jgi:hypothetical protein
LGKVGDDLFGDFVLQDLQRLGLLSWRPDLGQFA